MFWFNHIFFFIGVQFVGFMGGPSEDVISIPILISIAIVSPIVALFMKPPKFMRPIKSGA